MASINVGLMLRKCPLSLTSGTITVSHTHDLSENLTSNPKVFADDIPLSFVNHNT